MNFHLKTSKQMKLLLSLFVSLISTGIFAQDILTPPDPPRLVNDRVGILSNEQVNYLEQKLIAFNDSTSTQIAIVIIPELYGYDKADLAYRIGESWKIGHKGKNNGIVILVKPKNDSKGEVFIAPGYGLEGVVPDAIARRIVDNEMIPRFKTGDMYGGIEAAVNVLISLTNKEYTADEYTIKSKKKKRGISSSAIFVIIIVVVIIIIISSKGSNRHHNIGGGASSVPWWIMSGMGGSGSSGSSWGNFSSGSGSFGGFGGGSFGGGGAGGSW